MVFFKSVKFIVGTMINHQRFAVLVHDLGDGFREAVSGLTEKMDRARFSMSPVDAPDV